MATAPSLTSLEEYISTSYSPDCEYVDGVVIERNVGKGKHSYTRTEIAALLRASLRSQGLITLVEQRVQVSALRVRLPDVCVVSELEEVVSKPPLLCIEIFSPEDRWTRMNQSVADYLTIGVPCVWIIHPYENRVWIIDQEQPPTEVHDGILRMTALNLEISLSEVLPPNAA